ncbi:MAG: hypothetical protein K1X82_07725 [Bacteroidia bacterium]|nr:hypothetical protein [Bacteroidia bacterium]
MKCLELENHLLKLSCYPELGGKIASLVYKPLQKELLWQSQQALSIPNYGAAFSEYDKSGIDECFPAIDKETFLWNGQQWPIPDHGELWCQPWSMQVQDNSLFGSVMGRVWKYRFERTISLNNLKIRFDYHIQNFESFAIPGFWTFHPLFAAQSGDTWEWPFTHSVELAQQDPGLGASGSIHPFPMAENGELLNIFRPFSSQTTRKYYHQGRVPQGFASLHLNPLNLHFHWDSDQIPYLGMWINEGGYEGGYNLALEPSQAYYDSLSKAISNQSLQPILPQQSRRFWLEIDLVV